MLYRASTAGLPNQSYPVYGNHIVLRYLFVIGSALSYATNCGRNTSRIFIGIEIDVSLH